jgi:hypothetical protein
MLGRTDRYIIIDVSKVKLSFKISANIYQTIQRTKSKTAEQFQI